MPYNCQRDGHVWQEVSTDKKTGITTYQCVFCGMTRKG